MSVFMDIGEDVLIVGIVLCSEGTRSDDANLLRKRDTL
jgi:hypothetical protein